MQWILFYPKDSNVIKPIPNLDTDGGVCPFPDEINCESDSESCESFSDLGFNSTDSEDETHDLSFEMIDMSKQQSSESSLKMTKDDFDDLFLRQINLEQCHPELVAKLFIIIILNSNFITVISMFRFLITFWINFIQNLIKWIMIHIPRTFSLFET